MSGPVFVDTNVFVYQSDASDSEKQARADDWCATLWRSRSGRVSVQVLLELYATLTRMLKAGIDPPEAREIVGEISAWRPIPVDLNVIRRAWSLEQRYSLPWWDSLIVVMHCALDLRPTPRTAVRRRPRRQSLRGTRPRT